MSEISRRGAVAGLLGFGTLAALGPARAAWAATPAASADALIAQAQLGGRVGYLVADGATGRVLDARDADQPLPPASTAKVITSLYALQTLGSGYSFPTRLVATGPVSGGVIQGDLILMGGGDPTLDTDDLGDMAKALVARGVRGVSGRFQVWGGALPYIEAIDQSQPDWLGYNPSISGLNLNFNRVHFTWKRSGQDYQVGMDAPARRYQPRAYTAKVSVANREQPVYTYRKGAVEEWSVARAALGKGGSRWLPVRRPDLYAGDVFQTLARAAGCPLPAPERAAKMPNGTVLVEHMSSALTPILRAMMKYSNNMTAEAVGMAASVRRGASSHTASARAMTDWVSAEAGARTARFADHSGLVGASRISAGDMVRVLQGPGRRMGITSLMKEVPFRDGNGRNVSYPATVHAKTGTLNFVSTLAGYVTTAGGSSLSFAIFTGDIARRDSVPDAMRERPKGGREWIRRSKWLQQKLIENWVGRFG